MIYFDNAATSPMLSSVKELMQQDFGNPSSPHAFGLSSERAIKKAAKEIASILSCQGDEIIFTSGGTESNNLGILGAALALKSSRGPKGNLHIMASKHEHPSVIEPLMYLAGLPGFSVDFAAPSEWKDFFCEDTAMACLSQISGETGDLFSELQLPAATLLFVDGAQSFCKIAIPKRADIYSFSAHKINGPTGVGGLMVRKGIRLQPLMYGGGQQAKLRPGTENTSGILAMVLAAKEICLADHSNVKKIKAILSSLAEEIPAAFINQSSDKASPFILNMGFTDVRAETLTSLLSSKGLYLSMGAACRTSKKGSALEAMGFSKERAESSIRLSFSIMNTEEEAIRAKEMIKKSVDELRAQRPGQRATKKRRK